MPVLFNSMLLSAYQHKLIDPISLSPKLWYDFTDATTMFKDDGITHVSVDGDTIYRVNDKSGNSKNVVQTASSKRPQYKTNILGGKSAARFISSSYHSLRYIGVHGVTGQCMMFTVFRNTTLNDTAGMFMSFGNSVTVGTGRVLYMDKATGVLALSTTNAGALSSFAGDVNGSFHIWGGEFVSGTGNQPGNYAYKDGAKSVSYTINMQAIAADFCIGDYSVSAYPHPVNGDMLETIVFNGKLSDTDRNNLMYYFSVKYGIAIT